jgi:hypothetical protein
MIAVQLTNGFGNNLFQYIAGRQLAEFHKTGIVALPPMSNYYASEGLESLGVNFEGQTDGLDFIRVGEPNYRDVFDKLYEKHDFLVQGYFEDYTFFLDNIETIRSWFPKIDKRGDNDLVIHFRAGDRLFYKNEFNTKPGVDSYKRAIDQFNFDRMHIVTDMPKWDYITVEELDSMKFHHDVPKEDRVKTQLAVEYFNSFIDAFSEYRPLVEKRTVAEDFNFMRSFDNILFQHGTLSWWASVLSDARRVGVYGPWRPWKEKSNKNLSEVPLKTWFKWG